MSKPSDTWSWSSLEGEIKALLRIPGSAQDEFLQDACEVGISLADRYINRDFVDDDGGDIDLTAAAYRTIKSGIIEHVRLCLNAGTILQGSQPSTRALWNPHKLAFI